MILLKIVALILSVGLAVLVIAVLTDRGLTAKRPRRQLPRGTYPILQVLRLTKFERPVVRLDINGLPRYYLLPEARIELIPNPAAKTARLTWGSQINSQPVISISYDPREKNHLAYLHLLRAPSKQPN